ncbi:cytochrome P450 [Pseudaminobacter sp. NGMCC 1.201702]|uniref:cytochrome P450 n=1 Tax=Pseudaminobacter sp. NGMCC 1.201702 TaxID=3391825 RepID=UPI0039EF2316
MRSAKRLIERLRGLRPRADDVLDGCPLDMLASSFVHDPYPVYRRLREHDPVHRCKSGAWIVTRHRDIVASFAHPALGNAPSRFSVICARNRERYVCADVAHNVLPFLDKPEHVLPRRIIASVFRAHMKDNPVDIAGIARRLLEPHLRSGTMDAIADFGTSLSAEVISRLMGLAVADRDRLLYWSHHFFHLFAPIPSDEVRDRTDQALADFREYLRVLVQERRLRPGADLISNLLIAEDDGRCLSEQQAIDACMLLFSDGVENVDAGIANTLLALHRHPSEMLRARAAPETMPNVVLEGLRYNSPAQLIARVAREDLEIAGTSIRRDTPVFLALGAANRDPEVFEKPDSFDPSRNAAALLSFGMGRHSCIGGTLVRLQIECALRVLLQATNTIRIETDTLEWTPRVGHRWLKALPIRLSPR